MRTVSLVRPMVIFVVCILQPFMSPRYAGGPRGPGGIRMPDQFNVSTENSNVKPRDRRTLPTILISPPACFKLHNDLSNYAPEKYSYTLLCCQL